MRLIYFSVTNYRSITTAHKINLQNLTILVGRNNEGKSNILTALNVAMTLLMRHGKRYHTLPRNRFGRNNYDWERDFPIQLQNRKNGLESIFSLQFKLEGDELIDFHTQTGIRGNEEIPITVKIGKNNQPKIEVPKRGSSAYKEKSEQIAEFISERISFNYIQAVRTERMALNVLQEVIYDELHSLVDNEEYNKSIAKINELQQNALNKISSQLVAPLKVFLPQLKGVQIKKSVQDFLGNPYDNNFDVIIDDGIPTSISYKGDGIKSLAALAILKDRTAKPSASIIAIEEPESHLHSGAIHSLVEVINKISENNQVIITTHNPLFVQQNNIKSNIIVNSGTADSAKSISEIRNVLGVLPSDNLRNSNYVLVVEGEDDKISLTKILSNLSDKLKIALSNNTLVIKSLGGAGNLLHDLADLKNCMCNYFVLLDNDKAGTEHIDTAIEKGLLTEANYKLTICNGSPNSEFEDCLNTKLYKDILLKDFGIDIKVKEFKNNKKWSERIRDVRLSQGGRWNDSIEQSIKMAIAEAIPTEISDISDVLIQQKSGFIYSLITSLEQMLECIN